MTGTLPTWLERWLGLANAPGEGTVWRLEYSWPWPSWATLLLAMLVVAMVLAIYSRENRRARPAYRFTLAAMRLALAGMVLLMIAQFGLSFQRTGLPYIAVLVDDSRSMTTADRYENKIRDALRRRLDRTVSPGAEPTRWNLAELLLTENQGELPVSLAESYKLRFYYLTAKPAPQLGVADLVEQVRSLEPSGDSTRLGATVRAVLDDLRGTAPAAIILLTDGINTEGPTLSDAATLARRKGVPLFFIGIGSDEPIRDLRLSDLLVDEVVFVNDVVDFRFKLTSTGFQGTKIPVVLRQEGKSESLARMEVTAGPDGQPQEVRLPYRPTVEGKFRFTIEAEPPAADFHGKVAPLSREITVRKEKVRVLLAQAYPSFEFRYLRNLLGRDETVELHTVLQDADVEYAEQDKAALTVFPVQRDELFKYDVVILGDVNTALLGPAAMQNLAEFVDQPGKGGALVLLAGPKFMPQALRDTPLGRLMPFEIDQVRYPDPNKPLSEGFLVQPTDLGLASPAMQLGDTPEESLAIWQNLPPLYWMVEVPELKPGARVLAEHPTRAAPDGRKLPLIVMQYVGAGKVLFHATDETWRWRRRMGDVFLARYWVQTLRNLSRARLSEGQRSARLSTDRREYHAGDAVRLRVRFADERLAPAEDNGVTVVLEQPGRKQRVQLQRSDAGRGVFEAVVSELPVGSYHAWVAVPTLEGQAPAADFQVDSPPGESAHLQMATAEMRQAAEATKGRFYAFADADQLLEDLPEGRQVPIETLPPVPLWNRWPVLALFLVLLIGEWVLRKRGGMV